MCIILITCNLQNVLEQTGTCVICTCSTKVYEEILKSKVPPTIRLEESQGIRRQYLVVTTTRMDVNPVAPNFFR